MLVFYFLLYCCITVLSVSIHGTVITTHRCCVYDQEECIIFKVLMILFYIILL